MQKAGKEMRTGHVFNKRVTVGTAIYPLAFLSSYLGCGSNRHYISFLSLPNRQYPFSKLCHDGVFAGYSSPLPESTQCPRMRSQSNIHPPLSKSAVFRGNQSPPPKGPRGWQLPESRLSCLVPHQSKYRDECHTNPR